MKVYNIYHVVSRVLYRDGERAIFPKFITERKKLVATFRDKEYAKHHLDILKSNRLKNRGHINYEIIDGKRIDTDSHAHFYDIEEVDVKEPAVAEPSIEPVKEPVEEPVVVEDKPVVRKRRL